LSYSYKGLEKYFADYWNKLVQIHLADTTAKLEGKTNIKNLMVETQHSKSLFRYAYRQHEPQWRETWEASQMQIHLAGHTATTQTEKILRPSHDNHLSTYADQREVSTVDSTTVDIRPRVIIDSGAFTAFTTGKVIDPKVYAEWALDFELRWRPKMRSLHLMNLDVIGDQNGTWRNQKILENLGMNPLPIVTRGAEKQHLERALLGYDYIALGGLVPLASQPKQLRAWLDYCFAVIVGHSKKTGAMPKIHLLGITTDWVLKRYPCFSSDSSAWVSCLRFGGGRAAGLKKIPRYKESDAAMAATLHVLRAEIKRFKKMELEATNLWASRGIVFSE
jgi:hypothetical protein